MKPDIDMPLIWQSSLALRNCSSVTKAFSSNSNFSLTNTPDCNLAEAFYDGRVCNLPLVVYLLKLKFLNNNRQTKMVDYLSHLAKNIWSQLLPSNLAVCSFFNLDGPCNRQAFLQPIRHMALLNIQRFGRLNLRTKKSNYFIHGSYYTNLICINQI